METVVAAQPEYLTALAALLGVLVSVAVAVASGAWAVTRWAEERRRTREQEERLAREGLALA